MPSSAGTHPCGQVKCLHTSRKLTRDLPLVFLNSRTLDCGAECPSSQGKAVTGELGHTILRYLLPFETAVSQYNGLSTMRLLLGGADTDTGCAYNSCHRTNPSLPGYIRYCQTVNERHRLSGVFLLQGYPICSRSTICRGWDIEITINCRLAPYCSGVRKTCGLSLSRLPAYYTMA